MARGATVNQICKTIILILSLGMLCVGQNTKECNESARKYRNLEGQAIKKVVAEYPAEPGVHAKGKVVIWIAIDEEGNVSSARAICGHPFLMAPSMKAAAQWKFQPKRIEGKASKNFGVIVFHFKDVNRDRGN